MAENNFKSKISSALKKMLTIKSPDDALANAKAGG